MTAFCIFVYIILADILICQIKNDNFLLYSYSVSNFIGNFYTVAKSSVFISFVYFAVIAEIAAVISRVTAWVRRYTVEVILHPCIIKGYLYLIFDSICNDLGICERISDMQGLKGFYFAGIGVAVLTGIAVIRLRFSQLVPCCPAKSILKFRSVNKLHSLNNAAEIGIGDVSCGVHSYNKIGTFEVYPYIL